jgi:hypothetical protein
MKLFNRKKDISYKSVDIAKRKEGYSKQTLSIIRFSDGDYGLNLYNYDFDKMFDPIQKAKLYGSKKELINALELALEELRLL